MTTRAAFDGEEWTQVANAPALAGLLVSSTCPRGAVRESLSASRAYAEARREHATELLRQLAITPPRFAAADAPHSPAELRANALDGIRRAVALLERSATPEEVAEFRVFVTEVAETVARAHHQGGTLGLGGGEIAPAERDALRAVAQAAGVSA